MSDQPSPEPDPLSIDHIFAEGEKRLKRLMDELNAAPEVNVRGVVGASGASAGRTPPEQSWTLTVTLDAWRMGEEPIVRKKLTVRQNVSDENLKQARSGWEPYRVVSLRVRLAEQNSFQTPQSLLISKNSLCANDVELAAIAEELQRPMIVEVPFFGKFTLIRNVNWFEASARWGDDEIKLHLASEREDETLPTDGLAHARSLWSAQSEWQKKVEEYMVQELLETKNGAWLEEDESAVTAWDFIDRVTLESIKMAPDGSFQFWYSDGDLFWGHLIAVAGTLNGGLYSASIEG